MNNYKKEIKAALREAKAKAIEDIKKREALINHKTDFAMLEEFIKSVNENPGLKIKFTTADGTTVELETFAPRPRKTYTEYLGED